MNLQYYYSIVIYGVKALTYIVIEDYGKTPAPNKCFTCVMTHMITKNSWDDSWIQQVFYLLRRTVMNLDRKYSVESSNSYSLSEKSAALEADAAFYKYRMRGWRVKASLYCPSEYYLETFMIQHKIETKQDGKKKKKKEKGKD